MKGAPGGQHGEKLDHFFKFCGFSFVSLILRTVAPDVTFPAADEARSLPSIPRPVVLGRTSVGDVAVSSAFVAIVLRGGRAFFSYVTEPFASIALLHDDPRTFTLRVRAVIGFVPLPVTMEADHVLRFHRTVFRFVAFEFAGVADQGFGAVEGAMTDLLAFKAEEVRVPVEFVEEVEILERTPAKNVEENHSASVEVKKLPGDHGLLGLQDGGGEERWLKSEKSHDEQVVELKGERRQCRENKSSG